MGVHDPHPKRAANPSARRPLHQDKDYDRLIKAAWDAGWWCRRSRKNYIHCYRPSDNRMVSVPSTPRKQGTLSLTTRKFRTLGLDV
jgi:hypothetical protein